MNINTDKLSDEILYFVAIEHGIDMVKLSDVIDFYKSKQDLITSSESYVGSFVSYDTDTIQYATSTHILTSFEEAIRNLRQFAENARKERKHIICLQIGVDAISVQVANRQKCLDALRNLKNME